MAIPVMSPRLEVLTSLHIDCVKIAFFFQEVAKMSNGKSYTYPLFVESPPYSKFAVLFESEGERADQIITAIRID
jgi:hypothetical protein